MKRYFWLEDTDLAAIQTTGDYALDCELGALLGRRFCAYLQSAGPHVCIDAVNALFKDIVADGYLNSPRRGIWVGMMNIMTLAIAVGVSQASAANARANLDYIEDNVEHWRKAEFGAAADASASKAA